MHILRLISLEDRIVYDGAIAHAALAVPASHGSTSITAPAATSNLDIPNAPPNVLVISEGLAHESQLQSSARSDTKIIVYDPNTTTLQQLDTQIQQALNGQKAGNIGFATEGSKGQVQILSTLGINSETLKSNQDVSAFLHNVAKSILPNGSLDLFGSNIAKGDAGHEFLAQFTKMMQSFNGPMEVHAADHPVGSALLGGSWVVDQTDHGLTTADPATTYFNKTSLSQYDSLLNAHTSALAGTSPEVLVVANTTPDLAQFVSSVDGNAIVVVYDPNTASLSSIAQDVTEALNGAKASRIGFVTEGGPGDLFLIKGAAVDLTNAETINFFHTIAGDLQADGSVDLFGCQIAQGPTGIDFVSELTSLLNNSGSDITVNASVGLTGDPTIGGSWILGYGGVDVSDIYFSQDTLAGWHHTLDLFNDVNTTVLAISDSNKIALNISASYFDNSNVDQSSQITFMINNLPTGAVLSAGGDHGIGGWEVSYSQFAGLTLYMPDGFQGVYQLDYTFFYPNNQVNNSMVIVVTDPAVGQPGEDTTLFNVSSAGITSSMMAALHTVTTTISGVPLDAVLSSGVDLGGGTWSLRGDQIFGLTMTPSLSSPAHLTLTMPQSVSYGAPSGQFVHDVYVSNSPVDTSHNPTLSTQAFLNNYLPVSHLSIASALSGLDGNNTLTIQISNVPTQFTFVSNSYNPIGTDLGGGVWTFTQSELTGGINLRAPLADFPDNFYGVIAGPPTIPGSFILDITAISTDSVTNDVATASQMLPVWFGTYITGGYTLFGDLTFENTTAFLAPTYVANTPIPVTFEISVTTPEGVDLTRYSTLVVGGAEQFYAWSNGFFGGTSFPGWQIPFAQWDGLTVIPTSAPNFLSLATTVITIEAGPRGDLHNLFSNISSLIGASTPTVTFDPSTLSVTHVEGNVGYQLYNFTVNLDHPYSSDVTINYNTVDGTATGGVDYEAIPSGQLIIAAGQSSGTISVRVYGDATIEQALESFNLQLTGVTNGTLGASILATGLIQDDDVAPQISIDPNSLSVSHLEGDSGTTLYNFTVNLSSPTDTDVLFFYHTQAASATAGVDYVDLQNGQMYIAAGQTSAVITIQVKGDHTFEPDETFLLTLTGALDATLAPSNTQATGTIQNDDVEHTISINNITVIQPSSGTVTKSFVVTLSNPSTEVVTVLFQTQDNTATVVDGDYVPVGATLLTFQPGDTTINVDVTVNGSASYEPNETFFANLSDATNAVIFDGQGTALIASYGEVPFTLRYGTTTTGDISYAANTELQGFIFPPFPPTVVYANVDAANPSYQIFDSSSSDLDLPSNVTILYAALYWSGTLDPFSDPLTANISPDIGTVLLAGPDNGNYTTIFADELNIIFHNGGGFSRFNYGAFADVTSLVQANGEGTYMVANVQTISQFTSLAGASWTLAVAYQDATQPERTIQIYDGYQSSTFPAYSFQATGLNTPSSGPVDAHVGLYAGFRQGDAILGVGNGSFPSFFDTYAYDNLDDSIGRDTFPELGYQSYFGVGYTSSTALLGNSQTSATITFDSNDTTYIANAFFFTAPVEQNNSTPTVTFDPTSLSVSHPEGNSGTTAYTFIVNLSAPSASDVTIFYNTQNGSGTTADGDYQGVTNGQITIVAGDTSGTITILANGDTKFEPNESFLVNLTSATNGTLGSTDIQAIGNIQNDDTMPVVTFDAGSLTVTHPEGNSGTTAYNYTVNLSNPSTQDVIINYSTQNGTGTTADGDYQGVTNGQITILAGQTSGTLTILANGDTNFEGDENFLVNLTSVTNGTLGATDIQAAGNIQNDDTAPVVTFDAGSLTVTHLEGHGGTTAYNYTVNLSNPSTQDVIITYSTQNGTGTTADGDYQGVTNGQITILAGQTSGTLTILANGDTNFEGDENFLVNLTSVTNGTLGSTDIQAAGNIQNDDTAPVVTFDAGSLTVTHFEGNSGTTAYSFTVKLSNPSSQDVVIDYSTQNGTGTTADGDYQGVTNGQITVLAGQTSGTLTILVNGDTKLEPNENFQVNLTSITNGTLGGTDTQATGNIQNDDTVPVVTFDPSSLTVTHSEGDSGTTTYSFTVNLSNPSTQDIVIDYNIEDNSATTTDGDYQGSGNGQIIIPAGQTSGTITILVNGDANIESNEKFLVNLTGATNGNLSNSNLQASGIINNDDGIQPAAPPPSTFANLTPPPSIPDMSSAVTNRVSQVTAAAPAPAQNLDINIPWTVNPYRMSDLEMPGIVVTKPQVMADANAFSRTFESDVPVQGTFSIYLTEQPTSDVTIRLESQDIPSDMLSPNYVTFTPYNWNIPQQVDVKVPPKIVEAGQKSVTIMTAPALSQDPQYNGYKPANVELVVPDVGQIRDFPQGVPNTSDVTEVGAEAQEDQHIASDDQASPQEEPTGTE